MLKNSRPALLTVCLLTALLTAVVLVLAVSLLWRFQQDQILAYLSEEVAQSISTGGLAAETREDLSRALTQESLVVSAVEQSSPAVVSIIATREVPIYEKYYEESPGFFQFPIPRYRERGTEEKQVGSGSGFLVSADGLMVTNRHVIQDQEASYTAILNDGSSRPAEILALDPLMDIAILSIGGQDHPHLSFGDSSQLRVGQSVIAIGNALGEFEGSVSAGVISGLSRAITAFGQGGQPESLANVIQTDAAINPGNSGGPLLDLRGRVVGVNVATARAGDNIGFALPANTVAEAVRSVQESGEIVRPFLGVRYVGLNKKNRERYGVETAAGALLVSGAEGEPAVEPGSPADQAGLQEDDIITYLDGQKITPENPLSVLIRSKRAGQTVSITYRRNGEKKQTTATLEKLTGDRSS